MNQRKLAKLKSGLCENTSSSGTRLNDVLKTLNAAGFDVRRGGKSTHYTARHPDLNHPMFVNGTLGFAEKDGIVKAPYVKRICTALENISESEDDNGKVD
ncbi:hypothetical protein BMS3Bbin04_00962 [bacterium BMS3Bbin04]|nr:hypothetical protein BMS3Bbin04_00962 [bacterium BMS3Bbin04]